MNEEKGLFGCESLHDKLTNTEIEAVKEMAIKKAEELRKGYADYLKALQTAPDRIG